MTPISQFARQPQMIHWDFPDDQSSIETYTDLLSELESLFQSIQNNQFSLESASQFIDKFCHAANQSPWGLFRVFLDGRHFRTSVASTSLNTALVCNVFSLLDAWPEKKRIELTRAILFHDVGMLFLPSEILRKEGKLTDRERAILESHPATSFELVKKWGESYEATQVALQHHEEWGGTGYPSGLKGPQIHPWAALAHVCINFVARVTQRSYRNSLVGYLAMKQLVKEHGTRFDPETLNDFVRRLGFNPPGSIVLLSDGSIARVIELSANNPLRPRVRILIDSYGTTYRNDIGPMLDLTSAPKVFIARAVNFDDILNATKE